MTAALRGTRNGQLVNSAAGTVADSKTWFAVIGWEGIVFAPIGQRESKLEPTLQSCNGLTKREQNFVGFSQHSMIGLK